MMSSTPWGSCTLKFPNFTRSSPGDPVPTFTVPFLPTGEDKEQCIKRVNIAVFERSNLSFEEVSSGIVIHVSDPKEDPKKLTFHFCSDIGDKAASATRAAKFHDRQLQVNAPWFNALEHATHEECAKAGKCALGQPRTKMKRYLDKGNKNFVGLELFHQGHNDEALIGFYRAVETACRRNGPKVLAPEYTTGPSTLNAPGNLEDPGIIRLEHGDAYKGEQKDGKAHGRGTATLTNGDVYDGEWKYDRFHGQGTLTYPDGRSYKGEFEEGKAHGLGTKTCNGDAYAGQFENDLRHGQGTLTYANKHVYAGQFENDLRHGEGIMTTVILLSDPPGQLSDQLSDHLSDL